MFKEVLMAISFFIANTTTPNDQYELNLMDMSEFKEPDIELSYNSNMYSVNVNHVEESLQIMYDKFESEGIENLFDDKLQVHIINAAAYRTSEGYYLAGTAPIGKEHPTIYIFGGSSHSKEDQYHTVAHETGHLILERYAEEGFKDNEEFADRVADWVLPYDYGEFDTPQEEDVFGEIIIGMIREGIKNK